MTGVVVNLRQARKRRGRDEKESAAAANRSAFGRSKAEKQASKAKRQMETKRLDGHKRDA